MNWNRIITYALLVIIASFIAGTIGNVIQAQNTSYWTYIFGGLLVPLTFFVVFFLFARVQHERTWLHGAMVWLCFLPFSLVNLLSGQPLTQFFGGLFVAAVVATAGIGVGRLFHSQPQSSASETAV